MTDGAQAHPTEENMGSYNKNPFEALTNEAREINIQISEIVSELASGIENSSMNKLEKIGSQRLLADLRTQLNRAANTHDCFSNEIEKAE